MSTDVCVICKRREDTLTVVLDGKVVGLCETCYERGEDEVRVPLDMTEDEDEQLREGLPEFNGAFG